MLPPYERSDTSEWYTGTANAIYQNLKYMERYNPEYVLILSGDHIYKMDYEAMLDFHKQKNADVTIAAIPVPMEEASRFGVVLTDEDKQITEFEKSRFHSPHTSSYFYHQINYSFNLSTNISLPSPIPIQNSLTHQQQYHLSSLFLNPIQYHHIPFTSQINHTFSSPTFQSTITF